jgi:hypothetical protein
MDPARSTALVLSPRATAARRSPGLNGTPFVVGIDSASGAQDLCCARLDSRAAWLVVPGHGPRPDCIHVKPKSVVCHGPQRMQAP